LLTNVALVKALGGGYQAQANPVDSAASATKQQ